MPGSRIVLFGGSFNPIHNGHLIVGRAAAELLSATRLIFIPSPNPPQQLLPYLLPQRLPRHDHMHYLISYNIGMQGFFTPVIQLGSDGLCLEVESCAEFSSQIPWPRTRGTARAKNVALLATDGPRVGRSPPEAGEWLPYGPSAQPIPTQKKYPRHPAIRGLEFQGRRPASRSHPRRITCQIASRVMAIDILDVPAARSAKMIGTSSMRNPPRHAQNVISIWNA